MKKLLLFVFILSALFSICAYEGTTIGPEEDLDFIDEKLQLLEGVETSGFPLEFLTVELRNFRTDSRSFISTYRKQC